MISVHMGFRISEALQLNVRDIDAQRIRVHIRNAKGNKARWAVLPEVTLVALRHYCQKCQLEMFIKAFIPRPIPT